MPAMFSLAARLLPPILLVAGCAAPSGPSLEQTPSGFDPQRDGICLHYDHAADRDDGHSAAADRTILESLYGAAWIRQHVRPVSGAHGLNGDRFRLESDAVMQAVWDPVGGWLSAHHDRPATVAELARFWLRTLDAGGDIWIKEGGQSDVSAAVLGRVRQQRPALDTTARIHIVQHSNWNEKQTTPADLAFVKTHTDYIRIPDANAYLNRKGGCPRFVAAAVEHPRFGSAWQAAFAYYDPAHRLDFSDTGALMRIVGLGPLDIDAFHARFLTTP